MKKYINIIKEWLMFILGAQCPVVVADTDPESGSTMPVEPENTSVDEPEVPEGTDEPVTPVTPPAPPKPSRRLVILLDNGHAASTPGKRSPNEAGEPQFFEYEFNRDIARRVASMLESLGFTVKMLVPERDVDVTLTERANRANFYCLEYGIKNCLFLSIHANAAGNGSKWMTAKGWSCYTSKGETASDPYAEIFMREAEKVLVPMGRTIRKYSQQKYSWEENFTVLVKTKCPAILTENLFYDNHDEKRFLMSEEGRNAIARIHVNAIMKIENPDG